MMVGCAGSLDDNSVSSPYHQSMLTSEQHDMPIEEQAQRSVRQRGVEITAVWRLNENQSLDKIEIRLDEQKAYGYLNGVVMMIASVSTGREGYNTPSGAYSIIGKERHHKSNLYGSFVDAQGHVVNSNAEAKQTPPVGTSYEPAEMPFFLRLTDQGVGMHAGYLPGFAASHGCIRLPPSIAEKLFATTKVGTPVYIIGQ